MSNQKKPALGRGLKALLSNADTDITSSSVTEARTAGSISLIPVSQIQANPFQPRTTFEKEALKNLSESIREHGIIQPVTVRKIGVDKFELISGERRFRASQIAELNEVPAYVRIANDESMLEMALVENLHRSDLDAMEIALSFQRLVDECDLTQDELSKKVSKSRSSVANYLRLLKLPVDIQAALRDHSLSMGHARALINVESEKDQLDIFKSILKDSLSVRQTEDLVRNYHVVKDKKKKSKQLSLLSFEEEKFKADLSQQLKAKVQITKKVDGKGSIVIKFKSEEELERIAQILDLG